LRKSEHCGAGFDGSDVAVGECSGGEGDGRIGEGDLDLDAAQREQAEGVRGDGSVVPVGKMAGCVGWVGLGQAIADVGGGDGLAGLDAVI